MAAGAEQIRIDIGKLATDEKDLAGEVNPQQQNHDSTNHPVRGEAVVDADNAIGDQPL